MNKFVRLLNFLFKFKFRRIIKTLSEKDLVDIWQSYSPTYFSSDSTMESKTISSIAIYIAMEEMKYRHPNDRRLQNYQYDTNIKLI